jgi:hypothetical protein
MIILKPIGTAQTLKFIPREYSATKVVLRDEITGTETEITGTFTQDDYYLTSDLVFSLSEGRFYNLTVYNSSDIVYKDKIFCTSKEVLTYSINDGRYVSNTSNKEYIIL